MESYRFGWLLWLAVAAASCLPPLGLSPFATLAVAAAFVAAWVFLNVRPKRLLTACVYMVLDIFFREISARNHFKVPPEGAPCIFVCAPHANQFLDPFVVQYAVGRADLCFLAAAKTMRRRFIGAMARIVESVPVERAQDLVFKGMGEVWLSPEDRQTLLGRGTKFCTQLKPGDTVTFGGQSLVVGAIASDESLTLKKSAEQQASGWSSFKVTPRVDQSAMFTAVSEALFAGKAIGIFPEGGSHDQPNLLPLKAGIAIMAISTLASRPDLPLSIVPVGLNYFSGHRFRSRVFVDIGEPFQVPPELVAHYAVDKHDATARLMAMVEDALKALTVAAPDYDTLQFFWTLRRLTKSSAHGQLTLAQQVEFTRRFSVDYESVLPDGTKWKDTHEVRRVRTMCNEYNARLKAFGLRDYQVIKVLSSPSLSKAGLLLGWRVMLLVVYVACLLPMGILCLPLTIITRTVAHCKAKQAVLSSSVKIRGHDVSATWKLLVAIVLAPTMWLLYTAAAASLAAAHLSRPWTVEVPLLVFFFWPVVGYGAILAGERVIFLSRSLPPLLMLLLRPSYAQELLELREGLVLAMQGLVDDNGWRVVGEPTRPAAEPTADPSVDIDELERIHAEAATPRPSMVHRSMSVGERRSTV
ncbi:hypothetical protein AB1Y20_004392 [Prymnesium parvum]|uniref:Phospholipid/glycerol acyltransferase domain-containing protein n=1 Tax=Prymnesium parvum TaxID=97485 RepID=A0AB34IWI8_PRYPA